MIRQSTRTEDTMQSCSALMHSFSVAVDLLSNSNKNSALSSCFYNKKSLRFIPTYSLSRREYALTSLESMCLIFPCVKSLQKQKDRQIKKVTDYNK